MKHNKGRTISRAAGVDETQNRTVKHATGKMVYDTKRFRRDKSWKIYRDCQYRIIQLSTDK